MNAARCLHAVQYMLRIPEIGFTMHCIMWHERQAYLGPKLCTHRFHSNKLLRRLEASAMSTRKALRPVTPVTESRSETESIKQWNAAGSLRSGGAEERSFEESHLQCCWSCCRRAKQKHTLPQWEQRWDSRYPHYLDFKGPHHRHGVLCRLMVRR